MIWGGQELEDRVIAAVRVGVEGLVLQRSGRISRVSSPGESGIARIATPLKSHGSNPESHRPKQTISRYIPAHVGDLTPTRHRQIVVEFARAHRNPQGDEAIIDERRYAADEAPANRNRFR